MAKEQFQNENAEGTEASILPLQRLTCKDTLLFSVQILVSD